MHVGVHGIFALHSPHAFSCTRQPLGKGGQQSTRSSRFPHLLPGLHEPCCLRGPTPSHGAPCFAEGCLVPPLPPHSRLLAHLLSLSHPVCRGTTRLEADVQAKERGPEIGPKGWFSAPQLALSNSAPSCSGLTGCHYGCHLHLPGPLVRIREVFTALERLPYLQVSEVTRSITVHCR